MSPVAAALLVLLALVAAASLLLLALVVRISLRRSRGPSVAAEAQGRAVRDAASELIGALVSGGDENEVDVAARRLAGLLDIDPSSLRRAARGRRQ